MVDKKKNPMHRLFDEIQMEMDQLFSEIQTELSSDEWLPSKLPHYADEATKWFHERYPNKSELELQTWLLQVGWGLGQRIDRADSSLNNQTVSDYQIASALKETQGNRTKAAKVLGIKYRSLTKRLENMKNKNRPID
ncbi:helix-turn-helix domain-containing protein [Mariniblastus sp.]|nr:helix-turn-helix domain-containing protein [Mariniblastus sp.]